MEFIILFVPKMSSGKGHFFVLAIIFILTRPVEAKREAIEEKLTGEEEKSIIESEVEETSEEVVVIPWKDRLKKGLSRSRSEIWGKLEGLISRNTIDEETLEEIE